RTLFRQAKRPHPPAREAADLGMRLDALDEIAVGKRRLDRAVNIDAVRPIELGVVMSFHAADEIGRQECVDAASGGLPDITAACWGSPPAPPAPVHPRPTPPH